MSLRKNVLSRCMVTAAALVFSVWTSFALESMPGRLVTLWASKGEAPFRVAPPEPYRLGAPKGSTMVVEYLEAGEVLEGYTCIGWPESAKAAFNHAVGIWQTLVNSPVTIRVKACWASMEEGALGLGGPTEFYRNFDNAPRQDTWYPAALANALAGADLDANIVDMIVIYNSNADWYLGIDGNTPMGQYDFASVILHELCHGLGFLGSMNVANGVGAWGDGTGMPASYDVFAVDSRGVSLLDQSVYPNNSTTLASVLTGNNVYFNGHYANSANGGNMVKLFAPSQWMPGSSYAHLDEMFRGTENGLMCWSMDDGTAIHSPGPVTMGILMDQGWNQDGPVPPPPPPPPPQKSVINDYTGDGKSDVVVYNMYNGDWHFASLAQGYLGALNFGFQGAYPVPGDFDGDGIADLAVYHYDTGDWYIWLMAGHFIYVPGFGGPAFLPTSGDYTGDGRDELVAYNYTSGDWHFVSLTHDYTANYLGALNFGYPGTIPVPNDYDGDGIFDLAVYDYNNGDWYIWLMAGQLVHLPQFGGHGFAPVSGDYTGDGKSELVAYSIQSGDWHFVSLTQGYLGALNFGYPGAYPVPGNYDGDGISDLAVYDYNTGDWYIWLMAGQLVTAPGFGGQGFVPVLR